MSIFEKLQEQIEDHKKIGSTHHQLGIVNLPSEYALMSFEGYYYWLKYDGTESVQDWDKWRVYHGAKLHQQETEPF